MLTASASAQSAPDAWSRGRLRMFATFNPSRSESRELLERNEVATFLPMEAVSAHGDIRASDQRPSSEISEGFTYFRRADILVAKITPCFENGKGAVLDTLPTEIGFGSTEFIVLRARPAVDPRFLYLVTTTPTFREQGADAMTGSAGQQRVPLEFIKDFVISMPPLWQQAKIVDYLRRFDARFARLLHNKRRLIALLNEEKQAIIQQAVTRGLDPDVPLKPSGVEWLGDIPTHWVMAEVKTQYQIRLGKMHQGTRSTNDDVHVPYLKSQHVQWFNVRLDNLPQMWASSSDLASVFVCSGDLLVCEGGEAGRCGILKDPPASCIIEKSIHRVRGRRGASVGFLQYVLYTVATTGWFNATNNRSTIAHFTREKFERLVIPVPPVEEQMQITSMIEIRAGELDRVIDKIRREIDLIREYRTRLISDVVTGQLDVRDVQFDDDFSVENLDLGDVELLDEEDVTSEEIDEISGEEDSVA